jgi:hypothetical protein
MFRARGGTASGGAKKLTTDLMEPTLQLAAVVCGILAHKSGSEDKFVAEGGRNGASSFEQCLQMLLGGLLESQRGFAPVAPVRVTTRQQDGFRNPHAIFILPKLHFGQWNNHDGFIVACFLRDVKKDE